MSRLPIKQVLLCAAILLVTFDAGLLLGPKLTPAPPPDPVYGPYVTLRYDPPFAASATTGIFHERTCPLAPDEDDALYFSRFDASDAAGFVACERCNPFPAPS